MNRAATIALAPFSALYSAAVRARSHGYQKQFLKTHRVSVPVISVGNITVGGTGKTPLVKWLAECLAGKGRKVCILSRGYRRDNAKSRVVVSDGEQILSDVTHAGDEAMMLAHSLLGKAAVVCDADRVAGAAWAVQHLNRDVLLLDDGFQHRRLERDLDIVTIDATNPFGNGRLLPAGILREPVSSLNRADCIVLTRVSDQVRPELIERLRRTSSAPVLTSRTTIKNIRLLNEKGLVEEATVRSQPLAAFCAIGNSTAFFDQLREAHFDIRHEKAFRDHHKYSQTDIDRLIETATSSGAHALITTEKDAVKLRAFRFDLPCYVAQVEVEISDATKLLELIERASETNTN